MTQTYPHVKGVRRYALGALVIATIVGLVLVAQGVRPVFGLDVPVLAAMAFLLVGAIVGGVAVRIRSRLLGPIASTLLVLGVLPAGPVKPTLFTYALGLLFGLAILAMIELIHMTERYARAHGAVESANVPEAHINHVTDEAKKTLASRAGLAGLSVAAAIALSYLLSLWGPRQWRAATETTAPLGVAVAALAIAGAVSLSILARGAEFRLRRETPQKELLPDVAEAE